MNCRQRKDLPETVEATWLIIDNCLCGMVLVERIVVGADKLIILHGWGSGGRCRIIVQVLVRLAIILARTCEQE